MSKKEFRFTTAIRKIRKMKARKKIIQGGTSAGKTFGILPILIDKAIKNEGLEISVVSESYPHLRKGAIRDFLKVMKITGRYVDSHWNRTISTYTFSNGSFIEFFPATEQRGARRNILYVNEANFITFEAYSQLADRTDGDIYIDYNPTHRFWVHEELLNEPNTELLILTYKDNEGLSETTKQELEYKRIKAKKSEYWKNWCRVYLDGLDGRLEGVVFENWSEIDFVPDEAKLVGYGMDFGFTNDPTTLIAVYTYEGKLILDEIIYQKGLHNSDISNLLKTHNIKQEIFADNEPKTISELQRYGHNIKKADKGKDSITFGIGVLQEYEMLITKRSVNLIDEMLKYSWKKDKTGAPLNEPIDAFNHGIDAVRYLAVMKLTKKVSGKKTFRI